MTKQTIVIATYNQNKLAEYKDILKDYNVLGAADFDNVPDVEETGNTFAENAKLKAHAVADFLNLPVIADDSGLCVDALNGAPGVYSARYAGDHNEVANNKKLLKNLKGFKNRRAHYNTTLVMAIPNTDKDLVVEGLVHGEILDKPKGNNGFGYDSYFYYPILKKTFAEMTMQEKNNHSQRKNAMTKMLPKIDDFLKNI